MSAAGASAVLGRRVCALVAVAAAVVHGMMLGQVGSVALGGLVVAMMAACLYCARDLWTAGSTRACAATSTAGPAGSAQLPSPQARSPFATESIWMRRCSGYSS